MVMLVFSITLFAAASILAASAVQFLSPTFQFWPPAQASGWAYKSFRWLFRLLVAGCILLSILDFGSLSTDPRRHFIGVPLWVAGFAGAFHLTGFLGWRAAFGEEEGLQTDGIFRWSRNPIYVVTVVGMIGWGITVASAYVWVLLFCWAGFYIVAAYAEEPWLEERYGDAYRLYRRQVRRFI